MVVGWLFVLVLNVGMLVFWLFGLSVLVCVLYVVAHWYGVCVVVCFNGCMIGGRCKDRIMQTLVFVGDPCSRPSPVQKSQV